MYELLQNFYYRNLLYFQDCLIIQLAEYCSRIDQDKSFTSCFTSSIVLNACSTMRKRSLPAGTVGYKIGLTSKFSSCNCKAVFFTSSLPGIITICIGVC